MSARFEGKTVLMTGGAKGIGRAAVRRLLSEGARVACIELEPEESDWAKSLQCEAEEVSGRLLYMVGDVTSETVVTSCVARCTDDLGDIDVLINNVGFSQLAEPIDDYTLDAWDHAIRVNLGSAFLLCREVLPAMRRRGRGSIVNLSSIAGLQISQNAHASYHAAKAGILGLTRKIAFEEGPNGIRANSVSPGSVMTERVKPRYDALSEAEYKKRMASIPLRRGAMPEEIAAAILFLASDDASYITGANINVNGGRFMA